MESNKNGFYNIKKIKILLENLNDDLCTEDFEPSDCRIVDEHGSRSLVRLKWKRQLKPSLTTLLEEVIDSSFLSSVAC